ncbi:hypothetical protein BK120_09340 [Paenibacillus sp. FSL A5-0031]|uniref:hypothetical protein n=1 Tax=Paenibacillus sp. FSL A5-0031 TaxID=1920420 RepID=UPI00096F3568|nr:hypothetical protein [Paenibacillus sp. FSL A5-0031]OME86168.1 hypothetical protein BK120_09340 [Paenibacillus sp. FSL A5-0031]
MQITTKIIFGHLIRWLLILLACSIIYSALFSQSSIRVEKVAQHALDMMESPYAPISLKSKTGQGYELLLIVDRKHELQHQLFVKRSLGFFWSFRGGGFGMMLDPQIILSFRMGMSTFGKYRHYYAVGQLNDPNISRVQIAWWDGYEQDALMKDGVYLAGRSIRSSTKEQSASRMNKVYAYDANGQLLYELNDEQREIKADAKSETEMKEAT